MAEEMTGPPTLKATQALQAAAEALQNASLESAVGIDALSDRIKEQNKISQDNKTDRDRNQLLMDLVTSTERGDKEGQDNALALRSEFNASNQRLEAAIKSGDQEVIDLERESQANILANAETEENRREANKVSTEQSALLGKISSGIGGLVGFAKDNAIVAGGGVFAALALFNPELMEKIVNRLIEVLSTAMGIVKKLLDGDISGALELFGTEWKAFTGAFIFFFGGKIIKALKAAHVAFKGIMAAVQAYKMFLATSYAGSMLAHLKDMMKNLGNTLMKPLRFLLNVAKGFRVFMMASFIPGMMAAFTGMIAAITPMLVALAPILLPILAIAAVFGLIYLALEKMREALGFTSIFDVLMLGVAHLQDAFGHIVNLVGSYVNFILGLVKKFASFLGFEIDMPDIPKMSTDNAKKKKGELQEKAALAEEEAAAKKASEDADPLTYEVDVKESALGPLTTVDSIYDEGMEPALSKTAVDSSEGITPEPEESKLTRRGRRGVRKSDNTTGDELAADSMSNTAMQEQASASASSAPVVISQKGGDVVNNTTNNSTRSYRRPRAWRAQDLDSSYA